MSDSLATVFNTPSRIHRVTGFILLIAWTSLTMELDVLIGQMGIYPVEETMTLVAETQDFSTFPTHFWWDTSAKTLWPAVIIGCLFCCLAMVNRMTRPALFLSGFLYLSYCTVGRDFFSFQWDSLMIEMAFVAVLIPCHRASWRERWLPRLLLFKIMFFSGIAKWQSYLGDWHDGSAMSHYYETAPIPTWLAWYAHFLPEKWHIFESWWTLFFELAVPFLIFGNIKLRRIAVVVFCLFFIVDVATANYGFFVPQVAALSWLICLKDFEIETESVAKFARDISGIALFSILSACIGFNRFTGLEFLQAAVNKIQTFHLVNAYHLFGHITQERIEPVFAVQEAQKWIELDLHAKPGDPMRAPTFTTPFQPRVDFRLWFYGLGHQHGTPAYVERMVQKICTHPQHLQSIFETPIGQPEAIEMRFYHYSYCTPDEKKQTGCWWSRTLLNASEAIPCRYF